MNIVTKEEILTRANHGLTMGRLRQFILANPQIDDNAPILCERVQDKYYEEHGWEVYLVEGYNYFATKRMNDRMDEEIERRKNGEERQYEKIENPEDYKVELTDDLKEQFHPGWCITKQEDDLVLIYMHY